MRTRFCLQRPMRIPYRAAAGFTLVELMVAMTGGLFLTIIVFALSRDASRFYLRESRVANATLAGLSGFERLPADVARAGHLSTPNIEGDPHLCNTVVGGPARLAKLRGLVVEDGKAAVAATELKTAGIDPHAIVIAGALNTSEVLISSAIAETAVGWQVDLNLNTPAAKRLGFKVGVDNSAIMNSIFMAAAGTVGRIVRLRANGKDQYAVVSSVDGTPGNAFFILTAAPALQRLISGGVQCGIDDLGKDYAISVIDIVRYSIRSMLTDTNYAKLFAASVGTDGPVPTEAKRAELVRVELTADGDEIDTTREIVGEYAVDLQVSAWGATNATNPALAAAVDGLNVTEGLASTQLLRGVHLRFSVRSREADREGPIAGSFANDHYRIGLGATGGAPYARVRTFQSDIPLRNFEGSNW